MTVAVRRWLPRRRAKAEGARAAAAAALALGLVLAVVGTALAHEGEENVPARESVMQAIALLRSQPDQTDLIADKIRDALEANDAEGVDLDLVREASDAFDSGDLHGAWDLLEESIGAAPHRVVEDPNPEPGEPASTGRQANAPLILHEHALSASQERLSGPAASVLLVLALVAMGLGLLVAVRTR